jgi:hypothetical protein
MASKTQKAARKRVVSKNPSPQCQKVEARARRRVTYRALSNDEKCTMKLHIYLSIKDEWFLHKNSCVDHCNHLPIADDAMAKSANKMTDIDISMVRNLIMSISMYAICTYN